MPKPLPKSLHTVTVIVAVAREAQWAARVNHADNKAAIAWALVTLGYADCDDSYGLAAKALKVLEESA